MTKTFQRRCSVLGCDKKFYAKGYCNMHYNRSRLGTKVDRPKHAQDEATRVNIGPCRFPDCKGEAKSTGLCGAHYLQYLKRDKDMSRLLPLRSYQKLPRTGKGRECRTCHEFKTWDNYYRRSDSDDWQTECKECQNDRRLRNWENKNGANRKRAFRRKGPRK